MNKNALIFDSRANINWREEMHFYRRRRNREIRKERVKKTIFMKFWNFLIIFLLICILFYLIRETYFYLISWDKLNVKEIQIFTDDINVREELRKGLNWVRGRNILIINLKNIKQELMKDNRIESVSIKKILPSKLSVTVKLRKPIAVISNKGNYYFVDEKGVLFQKLKKEVIDLPIISFNGDLRKETLLKILSNLSKIKDESLFHRIYSIEIFPPERVHLKLKGEQFYLILNIKNFYTNLKNYIKILPRIKKTFEKLEYIDLRFKDRIYVKPFKEETNGKER